jgi:hypothetical protein
MKVEELRELARAAEPLSALSAALDGRERISYRDLLFRFLERVARARNDLVLGKGVESELEQELRLMAEALPPMRQRAEAGVQDGSGGGRH